MNKRQILLTLLSLFSFAIFVAFSFLVYKDFLNKIDFDTTVKFQDRLSRRWDFPFSILSLFGSIEVTGIVWLVMAAYLFLKRHWFAFLLIFFFWAGALIELFGKLFLKHPSPPYMFYRGVLDFAFPSGYVHTDYSYPSGHAFRTTFLTVVLIFFASSFLSSSKRFLFQVVLVFFLILMYVSRIYLGEHWFSDVIGGAMLGASFGFLSSIALSAKRRVKTS